LLINFHQVKHVFLVCGYTDLRKGIDGLASIVEHKYNLDLFDNAVFLFCGKRTDRFKALHFDGEGFMLLYKRYDQGKLKWPRKADEVEQLSHKQIEWLFDGFSIYQKQRVLPANIGSLI
jgi:transposase